MSVCFFVCLWLWLCLSVCLFVWLWLCLPVSLSLPFYNVAGYVANIFAFVLYILSNRLVSQSVFAASAVMLSLEKSEDDKGRKETDTTRNLFTRELSRKWN